MTECANEKVIDFLDVIDFGSFGINFRPDREVRIHTIRTLHQNHMIRDMEIA